jgi:ZIP family zinc transporter
MLLLEPFLLSLIAGLATGVGGLIVISLRRIGNRIVSLAMGFASGVMLMVAFNNLVLAAGVMTYITADELIPVAHEYGFKHTVSVGLLLGIIFALLIDTVLG